MNAATPLCVHDASVATKWFLREEDGDPLTAEEDLIGQRFVAKEINMYCAGPLLRRVR
jgi:hypothetical protein